MKRYVLDFDEIDRGDVTIVGGKGANLAALSRIDGVRVPPGFCVTTDAFRTLVASLPGFDALLDQLSRLDPEHREEINVRSAQARLAIESAAVPDDLMMAITGAVVALGAQAAVAVRSSATGEDLASASFAGQHDSYLNVVGPAATGEQVRRCWASLFTERAVTYRLRNGYDHRSVTMAVVVQRMVDADVAGILFTADPVTSNRRVASVESSYGLGEALVSGRVNADVFKVRDGEIIWRSIGTKQLAIRAAPTGGLEEEAVGRERRERPTLTDHQVVQLVELGRRIEARFGSPQDIEWCLADNAFHIVQSRPITTLFPIPTIEDGQNHVYVSVGHQQMMTDPMKALGLSVWQLTSPAPMTDAGGRLFVDVTAGLASPATRDSLLEALGRSDPLIRDALESVVGTGFVAALNGAAAESGQEHRHQPIWKGGLAPIDTDPGIVAELIDANRAALRELERDIASKSGSALFEFIQADLTERRRLLIGPPTHQVLLAGIEATWWLNEQLETWLGEANAADTLTLSAPHNVTSEMGLALLDVADVIRPHPEIVAFLERVGDDDAFLDKMSGLPGGPQARDAIEAYLDKYGMRCVGEIDITRPRWSERPSALVPAIIGNVANFEIGEAARRFERGAHRARQYEAELLERLLALPDGRSKADETKAMIDRVRTFIGFREYPKYGLVSRYLVYKRALMDEAERLVEAGAIDATDDVFHLRFDEFHEAVRTGRVDEQLIRRRKLDFASYWALSPPRVLTSDGEAFTGAYRRSDLPAGALVGLAVSAGTVEGRARVIVDLADARVGPGDIVVTAYTDPSWSPLFVSIAGLVTEVGGTMTHGAVVAREYGLPAVVGVEDATRLIADGQWIRVDGAAGYVELLPAP